MIRLLLIFVSAALFIFADFLSANWGKTGSLISIIIMIVVAPTAYFLFGVLNKRESLAISGAIVNLLIVLGAILIGLFYFGETINYKQALGLILGLVGILLLI